MAWLCEACGRELDSARSDPATGEWRCPACGEQIELTSTEVAPPGLEDIGEAQSPAETRSPGSGGEPAPIERAAAASGALEADQGPADTVFQPILMMESIMDELETPSGETPTGCGGELGTETLETDPTSLPSPFLQLDVEAFLLILGASPGKERRPLLRAKTTFGRKGTDVMLDDPAASSRHFQIEAFGKDFFVRDLESRNGTFLNGKQVRYSQLLPGDQITAGKTSLIFRTSDDHIDRD